MQSKYKIFRIIFMALFLVIVANMFYLQVIKHDEYESAALNQQTQDTAISAKRGNILDRNGNEIAISASAYKVILTPKNLKTDQDREKVAKFLSESLSLDYNKVLAMTQKNLEYLEVKRRIESDEKDLVANFLTENPDYANALGIAEDPKRYYPHRNLLSTVIGFVGDDLQGLSGLEIAYDDYLSGTPGKVISAKTAAGISLPFTYEKYIEAEDGCDLNLTIDVEMQYFLEKHIDNARVEHNVQNRVAGIIMDVKTGEILAMSTKPDFDPNDPFTITDEIVLAALAEKNPVGSDDYWKAYNSMVKVLWNNKLCEQYEPGSTFKILTSAMALEEGLVSQTESFHCNGFLKIATETIHCHKRDGHGTETFKEGLSNSCNPVFMELASRIGYEKFYNYITIFGLRDKTGAGVPGEQTGYHYRLADMNVVDLATSSFGQGFKITPLQLISAVCSVANDGKYMQPYIIKSITDSKGNIVVSNTPKVVKQTVSEQTSDILCDYLEYAVVAGKKAYLEGYKIAGKTGTSEKLDSGNDEARIASFIGFAPADDPQVCVLVVVDEPNSEVQYGSFIAAPLAKDILADALKHLNIEPDYSEGAPTVSVPLVVGQTVEEAKKAMTALGLKVEVEGSGEKITYQIPGDGKTLPVGSTVMLYTGEEEPSYTTTVPDVIGKTAAECNRDILNSGLNIQISGGNIGTPGVVAKTQSPQAGTEVEKGTVVTVTFE